MAENLKSQAPGKLRIEGYSSSRTSRRKRQITPKQKLRIIALREENSTFAMYKEKLAILYRNTYREKINAWKIQKTIERKKTSIIITPLKLPESPKKESRSSKGKEYYGIEEENGIRILTLS